ncbi:hypothetical protein EXS71_02710 [Candidatus Uhrbacteria bacterium]|nr:hypothetical protein [Candidatus Uhrbacteria bacterium]
MDVKYREDQKYRDTKAMIWLTARAKQWLGMKKRMHRSVFARERGTVIADYAYDGPVWGETGYIPHESPLYKYRLDDGRVAREFVQDSKVGHYTTSKPKMIIFLALRDASGIVIPETEWTQDEMRRAQPNYDPTNIPSALS